MPFFTRPGLPGAPDTPPRLRCQRPSRGLGAGLFLSMPVMLPPASLTQCSLMNAVTPADFARREPTRSRGQPDDALLAAAREARQLLAGDRGHVAEARLGEPAAGLQPTGSRRHLVGLRERGDARELERAWFTARHLLAAPARAEVVDHAEAADHERGDRDEDAENDDLDDRRNGAREHYTSRLARSAAPRPFGFQG